MVFKFKRGPSWFRKRERIVIVSKKSLQVRLQTFYSLGSLPWKPEREMHILVTKIMPLLVDRHTEVEYVRYMNMICEICDCDVWNDVMNDIVTNDHAICPIMWSCSAISQFHDGSPIMWWVRHKSSCFIFWCRRSLLADKMWRIFLIMLNNFVHLVHRNSFLSYPENNS